MANSETYLESFIEGIGTLPSELRRNLVHSQALDQNYGKLVQELRDCEEEYLLRAHEVLSSLPVQSKDKSTRKKRKIGDSSDNDINYENAAPMEKEVRISHLQKDNSDSEEDEDNFWSNPNEGIPISVPFSEESDEEIGDPSKSKARTILTVPTTEELRHKVHSADTSKAALTRIAALRRDARQMTEEKISNAKQTFTLVNDAIKSLDDDLEKFEAMLKTTGQYETVVAASMSGPQPNDLAAIQVSPNSPDWILAKVITHDPRSGMFSLSDEDIESNKTFTLPEAQVVILGGVDRLSRGDVIYAVYPDTTSFYQATVVQVPKKIPGKDPFVLVHFKDDGDENGITHEKAVLMKHIMRVPYAAIQ
uniref:SGF29 C-terminal domain-containing protein n=1 Tax=Chaetoceros debilis TaxID=122233 RepID=A0A7S3PV68_9STRA|mmetsp:Transcript_22873/g.34890  ORF Transcript_22873/g.34890 Transcript_22873/m.34890 type:complete len:364 (+) Transcript_22873:82-1173(+)